MAKVCLHLHQLPEAVRAMPARDFRTIVAAIKEMHADEQQN